MGTAISTPPVTPSIEPTEPATGFRLERLGKEEVTALLSFGLLAISAFLPWMQVLGPFQTIVLTGLQVARGEPGIGLLVLCVLGLGAVLFPNRHTGLACTVLGLVGLLESGYVWSQLTDLVMTTSTTPYVSAFVGSGPYLAVLSSLYLIADGFAIMMKVRASRIAIKAPKQVTNIPASLPPILTEKPPIPRPVRVSEFDVWIPILWLVVILFCGSLSNPRVPGWAGGFTMLSLATIWVYYDSKKRGMKNEFWIATLLLAVIGLPWYAHKLHKLRKTQQ